MVKWKRGIVVVVVTVVVVTVVVVTVVMIAGFRTVHALGKHFLLGLNQPIDYPGRGNIIPIERDGIHVVGRAATAPSVFPGRSAASRNA